MGGQQSLKGSSNNNASAAEDGLTSEPTPLSVQEVLENLVGSKVYDPRTPHHMANAWLVQSNPNLRRERNDALIAQRYLMALLYFSTSWNPLQWQNCAPDLNSECNEVCSAAAEKKGVASKRWLSCTHECEWFGAHCNNESDFVEAIQLDWNGLNGVLPPELAKLSHLRVLRLHHNYIWGSIPSEYGLLAGSLHELDLQGNELEESIPETLYNLTSLQILNLAGNFFTGSLSTRIGMLTSLEALFVQENSLSGQVPWPELASLTNLTEISLQYNRLSGTVLPELCDLFFEDPGRRQRVSSLVANCGGGSPVTGEGDDNDALPPPALSCSCCTDCCNAVRRECRANN